MFTVRFIRKDKRPDECYNYNALDDAFNHVAAFLDDNSNLYRAIVLSDESENRVCQILWFSEVGRAYSFKERDIVRLRPAFCDSTAARGHLYAVTNLNDKTMRCTITCLNSGLSILPSEVVDLHMVSPVGTTLDDIVGAAMTPEPAE